MDKDKLIEQLKERYNDIIQQSQESENSSSLIFLTFSELDLILTSLTAPVDGKEWITTDDELNLPEIGKRVLVYCKSQGVQLCYRAYPEKSEINWRMAYDSSKAYLNITHWMELPELPNLIKTPDAG